MGLTPPVWTMLKKTALFLHDGFPKGQRKSLWKSRAGPCQIVEPPSSNRKQQAGDLDESGKSRLHLLARRCIYWSPSYFSPLQNFWPTWCPWPAHPDVEESHTRRDEWWTPAGWRPGGLRSPPRQATASQDDRDRQSRHMQPAQTPHASLSSTWECEMIKKEKSESWTL